MQQATTRSSATETNPPVQGWAGTSLAELLRIAHIPPSIVQSVTWLREDGVTPVEISGDEVRDGITGDPEGGSKQVTVASGRGTPNVRVFRPMRSASDVNKLDTVVSSDPRGIQLRVSTSNTQVRTVTAKVDDATPNPGEEVAFTASVSDAPAGVDFQISWDYGDGSASDRRGAHTFAAGHYQATATAIGSDGSVGISSAIEIQVGTPAGTPTPTTTPTATATPKGPSAGKSTGTGGGGGDEKDRTSGKSKTHGKGDGTKSDRRSNTAARATATATSTPAATATAAPTTTATAAPKTTATPEATSTATAEPSATATATATPTAAPPAAPPKGELVSGVLLADAGSTVDIQRALDAAAKQEQERSQARRGATPGFALAGGVIGGGVVIALLGLGAALEGGFPPEADVMLASVEDLVFDVSNTLRVPVLVVALGALALVIVELGSLTMELVRRRDRDSDRLERAAVAARMADGDARGRAVAALQGAASSDAMAATIARLANQANQPGSEPRIAKSLADFDLKSLRRLERTRMLVRAGPALGLMGTLIPLSPALSGLANGDVTRLTENLRVAFSITVLGLLVGAVAYGISLVRDRLYAQDFSDLEFVAALLEER